MTLEQANSIGYMKSKHRLYKYAKKTRYKNPQSKYKHG